MSHGQILVVDDDPGIRIAISLKLRGAGFGVEEACDGGEGLAMLQARPYDLVVADVGMPVMDGYTMCQRMQDSSTTQSVPVIILTAQDMAVPDEVKVSIGRHRFLTKPFSPKELLQTVQELLETVRG